MANKAKANNILKHKRIIICSLLALGLIVLVALIYILTYANNKPKPFKDDSNVKISKNCKYFDFSLEAKKISFKGSNPKISLYAEISGIKERDVFRDVKVSYEAANNWTDKGSATSTDNSFNSGEDLRHSTLTSSYINETDLSLNQQYPIKVMPLVKVKHPIIYVKLTFMRKTNDSMQGSGSFVNEVVYLKYTYSDYCTNNTSFN